MEFRLRDRHSRIDYEHRKLVSMLNDIHSLIVTGADAEKIGATLCDFHALATAHLRSKKRSCRMNNTLGSRSDATSIANFSIR